MGWGKTLTTAGLTSATVAFGAAIASAQGLTSPVTGTLRFSTDFSIDTNQNLDPVSPGNTINLSEALSFTVNSQTRAQNLNFTANTSLRYSNTPGGGTSTTLADPRFTLRYFREATNSDLNLNGNYWKGDVVSSYDADPTAGVSIVVDEGELTTYGAGVTVRTGINAPLGLTFDANYNARDYSGTSDPNLYDTETTTLGVSANLRFSQVTNGNLSVSRTDYSAEDAASTNTETTLYGFSVSHDLRTALTLNGNVNYRDRTRTTNGGSTVTNGYSAGIGLTQGVPDGSYFGNLQWDATTATERTSLTFGRQINLKDGSLSASITAANVEGTGLEWFGNASYTRQHRTGSMTFDLAQSVTTNQNDEDIRFSQVGLGYQQQVNAASSVNLKLDLSRSEDGGAGAAPTQNRATLTAQYSQALTADWNLNVGYRHRRYSASNRAQGDSDSVFMTLSRNLQFGF